MEIVGLYGVLFAISASKQYTIQGKRTMLPQTKTFISESPNIFSSKNGELLYQLPSN